MDRGKSSQLAEQVRKVILVEFARIMETDEGTFSKFILIVTGIEYLGACLDKRHLTATARSEKRFNSAILKLFPNKYHHFTKQGSVPYLYSDLRNPVIHRLMTGEGIMLIEKTGDKGSTQEHLTYRQGGPLILAANEFYRDLAGAAEILISQLNSEHRISVI